MFFILQRIHQDFSIIANLRDFNKTLYYTPRLRTRMMQYFQSLETVSSVALIPRMPSAQVLASMIRVMVYCNSFIIFIKTEERVCV